MASQGDLLMQRKQRNNGETADEDSARRYPNASGTLRMPLRKSMAESPQFIETLKRNASSKGRPSICLTSPTSGSMGTGYAAVPRQPDPVVVSREERQREIIEQRKIEEDEVRALNDSYRSDYHAMLRERERTRLRQRTIAREDLQARTLPALCGSGRTVAAAQREVQKKIPQAAFVEANRDRMEVNLIRRNEERSLLVKRQASRRTLEMSSGTAYALSQSRLGALVGDKFALQTTPEEAHDVLLFEEEDKWQRDEEARNIRSAMSELDALDARLHQEEMHRKEERLAKKKELREASVRK